MTAVVSTDPVVGTTPPPIRVVLALAAKESRRMLLSPWLAGGMLLSTAFTYAWLTRPQQWNGDRWGIWLLAPGGLYIATSLVVAWSFHRARAELAVEAPVGQGLRFLARLVASLPVVGLTVALTAGLAAYVWGRGGLDLGYEPGRTLHAHPTFAELCQPVVTALLAVGLGAALGRRLRHRATTALVLLAVWFPSVYVYWAWTGWWVRPFAIVQFQPVGVVLGRDVDPWAYPSSWLLDAPDEYDDRWARLVTSETLAWWHSGWLLGVALLALGAAAPRRWRRPLLAVGGGLAVVSIVAQFLVNPR